MSIPCSPDRAAGAIRPDPAHGYSRSTRYLCAAAHLDESFWRACLSEIYYRSDQAVAPSYGFDLLPVLGHCLRARDMVIVRDAAITAALLAGTLTALLGTAGPAGSLLAIALAAVPVISHRLWRQRQLSRLGPGRLVRPPKLSLRLAEIREQQASSTIIYSGHRPFIGSGELIHQGSLAGRLAPSGTTGHRPGGPALSPARKFDRAPFTAEQILDHVADTLRRLGTDPDPERQIRGLTVRRRAFLAGAEQVRRSGTTRSPAEPRHYLVCQVVSWYGELVTSVYVHIAVRARWLYLQMRTTALPPCDPRFRVVDVAGGAGPTAYLRAVGHGVRATPRTVLTAPLRLVCATADLITGSITRAAGSARSARAGPRYGARVSVRELGAAGTSHDTVQVQDVDKYAHIIQCRVVASILDFVRERGVDPAELDERIGSYFDHFNDYYTAAAWHTGGGSIHAERTTGQEPRPFGFRSQAGAAGYHQPSWVFGMPNGRPNANTHR